MAEWLQMRMFPQTLESGRLSLDDALRINYRLISRCNRSAEAWTRLGKWREVLEVAYELRVEVDNEYCPVCNPVLAETKRAAMAQPLRLLKQVLIMEDSKHSCFRKMSRLEFLAVAEQGMEPDFPIYSSADTKEKIASFCIGDKSYDFFLALPMNRMEGSMGFKNTVRHVHKATIYSKGAPVRNADAAPARRVGQDLYSCSSFSKTYINTHP